MQTLLAPYRAKCTIKNALVFSFTRDGEHVKNSMILLAVVALVGGCRSTGLPDSESTIQSTEDHGWLGGVYQVAATNLKTCYGPGEQMPTKRLEAVAYATTSENRFPSSNANFPKNIEFTVDSIGYDGRQFGASEHHSGAMKRFFTNYCEFGFGGGEVGKLYQVNDDPAYVVHMCFDNKIKARLLTDALYEYLKNLDSYTYDVQFPEIKCF